MGGASRARFQPPRAGLCQRRPSLSKEGNLVGHYVVLYREIRNPKEEKLKLALGLRHSFVIGASSLVIHPNLIDGPYHLSLRVFSPVSEKPSSCSNASRSEPVHPQRRGLGERRSGHIGLRPVS